MRLFLLALLLSSTAFAADAPKFENVTTQVIPTAPEVAFHMWAGMPDVNNDGWLDLFVGSHGEAVSSAMYINNGTTINHFPNTNNYSIYVPPTPRCTSRPQFGNWYNNPLGLPSFICIDADLGNSSRYQITGLDGDKPVYVKSVGCYAANCVPADVNGDGIVEFIYRDSVKNAVGQIIHTLAKPGGNLGSSLINFDVNGDGLLELVRPYDRGYYTFNQTENRFDWIADKFSEHTIAALASSGHSAPFDLDNDGDLDLYFNQVHYSPTNAPADTLQGPNESYPHVFRNDAGFFTEISVGLPAKLGQDPIFTSYTRTQPADVNLDGFMDLVFCAEKRGDTTTGAYITMILNNGDSTLTVNRTNRFGGFSSGSSGGRPWCTLGDYDNNGTLDLVKTAGAIGTTHNSIALFKNTTANGNHWLKVRAQGKTTDGLGATIKVESAGKIIGYQQIHAYSIATSNLLPHFGLGKVEKIDLTVQFPNGGPTYTHKNLDADQDVIVRLDGSIVTHYTPGINPLLAIADGTVPPVEPPVDPAEPSVPALLLEIEMLEAEAEQYQATIATLEADQRSLNVRIETLEARIADYFAPKTCTMTTETLVRVECE